MILVRMEKNITKTRDKDIELKQKTIYEQYKMKLELSIENH